MNKDLHIGSRVRENFSGTVLLEGMIIVFSESVVK